MKKRHLHKRFLAPQARHGDGHGYLNQPSRPLPSGLNLGEMDNELTREAERVAAASAMCDEPECLTGAEWTTHVDKRAKTLAEQQQKFEDAQREQARRMLSFEERLAAAVKEAKGARERVDISRDVRLLRQMQQAGKGVRHLEQRLFLIERKVWSKPDTEAA